MLGKRKKKKQIKTKELSYSQKKREKFDYRTEYFRHNPGFLGCIWKCAYCQRLIIGKSNVQVDHIMPLNNVLGKNARFNLVAACGKCNRKKSDKAGWWVIWGYINKALEVIFGKLQQLVILILVSAYEAVRGLITAIAKLLIKPFNKTSFTTKVIAIAVYCCVGYIIYARIIGG